MASQRDKFPDQPEELPLGIDTQTTEASPRFDPDQLRAFGSIPNMISQNIDIPPFERLDTWAWEHSTPTAIASGLFGRSDGTAVDGLALGADNYTAIIRNIDSFDASIRAKTIAANRGVNNVRHTEKELRSILGSLTSKQVRHQKVLQGISNTRQALVTVSDMQRTPGYHRHIGEADVRMLATTVWDQSFMAMLRVLKDQHGLSNEQVIDMTNAMSHRLLKGSQNDKVKNWGDMLALGTRYNRATGIMFARSSHQIDLRAAEVSSTLEQLYADNGIISPSEYVVAKTTELQ